MWSRYLRPVPTDRETPLSARLDQFIAESPAARRPHVDFLRRASASLPSGSTFLDVGSGDAPYRELFDQHRYVTCDWEQTIYAPETAPDIVAAADDIPLEDASVDAILCTQVLEHVAEPRQALAEFHRLLRPGATVWITAPLTWYLHETPHDYYRYTPWGMRYLLESTGFVDIDIHAMNNSAETVAELLRQLQWIVGSADDGRDEARAVSGRILAEMAGAVESYGYLDTQWLLPISFASTARRPA